jgi:predicted nucleic acid-binding protein
LIILDASALYPLAKLLRNRVEEAAEKLLQEDVAILDLTLYEAANAAIIEARRGLIREPRRMIEAITRLAEQLKIIRTRPEDIEGISSEAERLGITAYDAAYIYYARLQGAKLVTSDKEILSKARDVAVSTEAWIEDIEAKNREGATKNQPKYSRA